MSPVRMRRAAAAAVLAVTAGFTLSACGSGFNAATNKQYQAAAGADHRTGDVNILNTLLVADDEETTKTDATVVASVLNRTDDELTLTGVTAESSDGRTLTVEGPKDVPLASQVLVRLGAEGSDPFRVTGVDLGRYVTLTFTFDNAPEVEIEAPIVGRGDRGVYEQVPSEAPSSPASPEPTDGSTEPMPGEVTPAP